jgi:pimeloyl-ACP methyl ester carboxylesterase
MRALLTMKHYSVHGWSLGSNLGPHGPLVRGMRKRLLGLRDRHGRRVSLIGWSLGGIYARELARDHPDAVRQVITLGAPYRFRTGDRAWPSTLYDVIGPRDDPYPGREMVEERRTPLPVPSTSIYTRTDGVVRWHACIDADGPNCENIEVRGTHSGLGYNIAALVAMADRLAQREGAWQPFRPPLVVRHLYPRPTTWRPSAADRAPLRSVNSR